MNKKNILLVIVSLVVLGGIYAMTTFTTTKASVASDKIQWYTLEEAVEANKTQKKKFAIDVYTSWCHWCKVMDKETFTDREVINYLNEHFYAIKFDGEYKENLTFRGKEYKFVNVGRRGINSLAYFWLNGRAAYPTIVYLDESMDKIKAVPGFKKPQQLLTELKSIEMTQSTLGE